MKTLSRIEKYGHEQVVFCHDKATGLRAIIAIHNTVLGPALGGCRMWPFASEEEAIEDALRLSRGMTYKNAAAGLNLGGGKAVIIGDPKKDKSEALFRAFGQFVQSLGGRYITAEDVGTCVQDMEAIKMETDFVAGLPVMLGGSGDPSPFTALGTFQGIRAAVKYKLKKDKLKGLTVAVQGVGHVGYHLCKMLHSAGAQLIVADIDAERAAQIEKEFNARVVNDAEIISADADVFAPCALGAVVNDETIDKFKTPIIAGAANNVLLEESHGSQLRERSILYAPDYIINAGGVINVYFEVLHEYNESKVTNKVEDIYNILLEIFSISDEENISTTTAASRFAERRVEIISKIHQKYFR